MRCESLRSCASCAGRLRSVLFASLPLEEGLRRGRTFPFKGSFIDERVLTNATGCPFQAKMSLSRRRASVLSDQTILFQSTDDMNAHWIIRELKTLQGNIKTGQFAVRGNFARVSTISAARVVREATVFVS